MDRNHDGSLRIWIVTMMGLWVGLFGEFGNMDINYDGTMDRNYDGSFLSEKMGGGREGCTGTTAGGMETRNHCTQGGNVG